MLSESPSRAKPPVVVVKLELSSIPFIAPAVKAENEDAVPSKITLPFEPDTCAFTFSATPFEKVDEDWVTSLT